MSAGKTIFVVLVYLALVTVASVLAYFQGREQGYNKGYVAGRQYERHVLEQQFNEARQRASAAHRGISYLYERSWREIYRLAVMSRQSDRS